MTKLGHKLEALAEHCERLGRDRSEITVTKLTMCIMAPTMEEAEADLAEMAGVKGWNDEVQDMLKNFFIYGDVDTVGEALEESMAMGIDGLTINLPVNGHKLERIAQLGELARPIVN